MPGIKHSSPLPRASALYYIVTINSYKFIIKIPGIHSGACDYCK